MNISSFAAVRLSAQRRTGFSSRAVWAQLALGMVVMMEFYRHFMTTTFRSAVTLRSLMTAVLLGLGCSVVQSAAAQVSGDAYPSRPIRLIVAFGAGSSTDITARLLAERMGAVLGKPIVVENRAGAGGGIGTDLVAKAAPDGYTLTLGTVGTLAINKSLYRKLPYDPGHDFEPISVIGYTPTLLVTRSDAPFSSIRQLIEYARAHPGKVTFASAGNGTSGHLAGALLGRLGQVELQHIPYKEGGQAMTSVLSGETDFLFYHPTAVMSQVKAGKLRAIGTSSALRSSNAPEVPTVKEAGLAPFDLIAWYMLAAPKGVPPAVLDKLENATRTALSDQMLKRKLLEQGVEPSTLTRGQLPGFLDQEIEKWASIVQQAGAVVD